MSLDLYTLAQRLVGEVQERPGPDANHPFILWCHEATTLKATTDEVPWCSSFINRLAQLCGLPRTKSAAARSWLNVGTPIASITDAHVGDVVILKRGQPPSGHVGLFAGLVRDSAGEIYQVQLLGGNQSDGITIAPFRPDDILGIRRLG